MGDAGTNFVGDGSRDAFGEGAGDVGAGTSSSDSGSSRRGLGVTGPGTWMSCPDAHKCAHAVAECWNAPRKWTGSKCPGQIHRSCANQVNRSVVREPVNLRWMAARRTGARW